MLWAFQGVGAKKLAGAWLKEPFWVHVSGAKPILFPGEGAAASNKSASSGVPETC